MSEQNGISEYELGKLGYVKLADDEQVVKKVELTEQEAGLMEENKHLEFFGEEVIDFKNRVVCYASDHSRNFEDNIEIKNRLTRAYFYGYTVKKEPKYYIKLLPDNDFSYLNIDKNDGEWALCDKEQTNDFQTQFIQKEINELQKDEQARELNLNALKVRVPDEELAEVE